MDKCMKQLIDNKLSDGSIYVFCTKWNASMGAKYITVYGNDLYVTPYIGGIYGVNVKKAIKINKQDIKDMKLNKSFWTGYKLVITLKDGKVLKYTPVNKSWLAPANALVNSWFLKK